VHFISPPRGGVPSRPALTRCPHWRATRLRIPAD